MRLCPKLRAPRRERFTFAEITTACMAGCHCGKKTPTDRAGAKFEENARSEESWPRGVTVGRESPGGIALFGSSTEEKSAGVVNANGFQVA